MTVPQDFAEPFHRYLIAAQDARANDHSERQRSALLLGFLQVAFGVEASDFRLEHRVILNVKRKGYIDALFGDLVFEFKRQIRVSDRDQLEEYLQNLPDGDRRVGLLTDGLKFEVHVLTPNPSPSPSPFGVPMERGEKTGEGEKNVDNHRNWSLRNIDNFDLEKTDVEGAFIRLDKYLFSQTNVAPTTEDVVERFGSSSPTFERAFQQMKGALAKVQHIAAVGVWRDQWNKLLSKVYGSDIGDDDLYLRHTYLCQFAKLLAYAALRGLPHDEATIEQIITGKAFYGEGVGNIGEHDFFAWVLLPDIQKEMLTLFRRLAEGLIVYDLSKIDQDLLKQLYQNLVDPATRHDLGEYYTPDWLAELTLQDIDYHYPQSLLDPACGSGSFLFSAIKRLATNGLTGAELVRFAAGNIMGMDVHPLAITIARINYLLALSEHLRGARLAALLDVPVYMADALTAPELESKYKETLVVPVDEKRNENFFIPVGAANAPEALTHVIDQMEQYAVRTGGDTLKLESYRVPFDKLVRGSFESLATGVVGDISPQYWTRNLNLLAKLIQENRNSIWAYILKNQTSPLVLAERKFDVIVGNPPWLSYRYIKSKIYQKTVKELYKLYGLIESGDVKLFTQMDLSTLFFAHASRRYLKAGGTIAFVMPRSVITGAKQHRPFQAIGFTRVLDLKGVEPLFNVETCVLVKTMNPSPDPSGRGEQTSPPGPLSTRGEGEKRVPNSVAGVRYVGRLKAHELSWAEAAPNLTAEPTMVQFVDSDVRSPYYHERFLQGASLVPRNLCFVKPEGIASSPAVVTDPDADKEAKVPWKGIKLFGVVDDDYLYATLLSKHLLPFGYERLHMVALPVRLDGKGALKMLEKETAFAEYGHFQSYDWFRAAEDKWESLKQTTTTISFIEQLNYRNKLTDQIPNSSIRIIYNATGTHISACVIENANIEQRVYGRSIKGFFADYKTYLYVPSSVDEAHYLCALLNSPYIDTAIKAYQPRGIYKGARGIERTPFEACAIPPFDAKNKDHQKLAQLSQEAHEVIEALKAAGGISGSVYKIRQQARAATAEQIAQIDVIAKRVTGL